MNFTATNTMDDKAAAGPKRWVCPSDRELTLRAKLKTGWSSRANADIFVSGNGGPGAAIASLASFQQHQQLANNNNNNSSTTNSTTINEAEQASIARVLERANRVQEQENERVRILNERLERIKKQARGNGRKNCILCNDQQRFFSNNFYTCKDCQMAVCNKCSIDTYELQSAEQVWLCKICWESRELLKKTNMWWSSS